MICPIGPGFTLQAVFTLTKRIAVKSGAFDNSDKSIHSLKRQVCSNVKTFSTNFRDDVLIFTNVRVHMHSFLLSGKIVSVMSAATFCSRIQWHNYPGSDVCTAVRGKNIMFSKYFHKHGTLLPFRKMRVKKMTNILFSRCSHKHSRVNCSLF